jgi:hypothetical protein
MLGMCVFLSQAKPEQVMYGNVKIHDVTIDSEIKVIGVGLAKDSIFDKDVTVFGFFEASNSQFFSSIKVMGSDVVLKSNHIEGDVHITNYIHKPKLRLRDTTIEGKVIFHGLKSGLVDIDSSSRVVQGVENGEVKKW